MFKYNIVGLTDYHIEGVFSWRSDGMNQLDEFGNWRQDEPNDFDRNEDCVHLDHNGQWNDLRCLTDEIDSGNIMSAMCQIKT